jgi:hypothetical protein
LVGRQKRGGCCNNRDNDFAYHRRAGFENEALELAGLWAERNR